MGFSMLNLSIIIPHYNSPELLKKLLDSIPKKEDIEIIVIDDRSTKKIDKLHQLINNKNYNHITFLKNDKQTKGAGTCRNIGLEKAEGQWVLFADADDYFLEGFYDVVSKYFDSNNDVVFFNPTSIYLDTGEKADRHEAYRERVLNYKNNKDLESELSLRYGYSVPWSKLIKRDFIEENNIRFDEVIASNDVMFSTKVGYYMDEFTISEEIIYCTTRNKGSLTVNESEIFFDVRLDTYIKKYNYLKNRLSKKKMKYINMTGQEFLFKILKYRLGIQKFVSVYLKCKKNNLKLFEKKLLNPIYFLKKICKKMIYINNNH